MAPRMKMQIMIGMTALSWLAVAGMAELASIAVRTMF